MLVAKTKVLFSLDGNDIEYAIFHPEHDAVDETVQEWLKSTDDYSNQSLCAYLTKALGVRFMTRAEAKQLNLKPCK